MTQHAKANTVSVSYLQALFDYAQARGLARERLLEGRPLDNLGDREARIAEADAAALFERAAVLLQDDALGLHAGERIRPGHYGVLGYAAMNCSTLGEALFCLERYQRLVIDVGTVGFEQRGDDTLLSWPPDPEPLFRQLAEFNFAGLRTFTRWISGSAAGPRRLDFNYPAPVCLDEHRRVFGCELHFDQPCYRLWAPREWLAAPLIQPDPEMRALMLRLAEKQMFSLARGGEDTLSRARSLVARHLSRVDVELSLIAGGLAMSPRSLQRALQDAGLNFSQLVDQVRRELSERYLADRGLDLTDVAFLLGFSEQSAFTRAFKRWTGLAPSQYRARQAG